MIAWKGLFFGGTIAPNLSAPELKTEGEYSADIYPWRCMSALSPHYVRTTSHKGYMSRKGYMSFSRRPHTHAVRVTARNRSKVGLWSAGSSG